MSELIITHDDRLILRARKHKAGLKADWYRRASRNGEITGYWNKQTGQHHGAEWTPPPESPDWTPCTKRIYPIDPDTHILAYDNNLDLQINHLWTSFVSRYKKALNALLAAAPDLFEYNPLVTEPTARNRLEAFRYRLRNQWKVARYEHNLLLRGSIANVYWSELCAQNTDRPYENTIYIKGFKNAQQTHLKAYRTEIHGQPESVKIETTLRYNDLKDLSDPNKFTTQPEIQSLFADKLKTNWRIAMSNTPQTKTLIRRKLPTGAGLFDALAQPEYSFESVCRRLNALEASAARNDARIEVIETDLIDLKNRVK